MLPLLEPYRAALHMLGGWRVGGPADHPHAQLTTTKESTPRSSASPILPVLFFIPFSASSTIFASPPL